MEFGDAVASFLREAVIQGRFELAKRGVLEWLIWVAPCLFLLEVPRYFLASWSVLVAQWFGFPKRDRAAEDQLLARRPLVSVVVAGRNESASIEDAIRSLLDQSYRNIEILVIDDCSDDNMDEIAGRYAKDRRIRFIRNRITRTGRPGATNIGVRLANGEFIVSVDADTTFDRDMVENMIRRFIDPRVGVVAGNVLVRNFDATLVTRLQQLEYALGIDLRKRWTDMCGCTLQASGAIGAFRRAAVKRIHGWDPELAEDADISLRMRKAGYRIAFAPDACAWTEAPDSLQVLIRQRMRWDRGTLRTYFRRHVDQMRPWRGGWNYGIELFTEHLLFCTASLIYPVYLVWMLLYAPWTLLLVMIFSAGVYVFGTVSSLIPLRFVCTRSWSGWGTVKAALWMPIYKELMRWPRILVVILELMWIGYEDPYLPDEAWREARRG